MTRSQEKIKKELSITVMVATDRKGLMGHDGSLPWSIPSDLQNFKNYTENKVVLMGRKTFESLPSLLANRTTIVISKNRNAIQNKINEFKIKYPDKDIPLTIHVKSVDELLNCGISNIEELVVVGGNSVYNAFYQHADKFVLTLVEASLSGDTYFGPRINWSEWEKKVSESSKFFQGAKDEYGYTFNTFYRKNTKNIYDFKTKKKMTKKESLNLFFK